MTTGEDYAPMSALPQQRSALRSRDSTRGILASQLWLYGKQKLVRFGCLDIWMSFLKVG